MPVQHMARRSGRYECCVNVGRGVMSLHYCVLDFGTGIQAMSADKDYCRGFSVENPSRNSTEMNGAASAGEP